MKQKYKYILHYSLTDVGQAIQLYNQIQSEDKIES